MGRKGTAIIAGGSIAGLFAAAALRKAGWSVQVFERAASELSGRGAGIVTHDVMVEAFKAVGAQTSELGVPVAHRVAFDRACDVVRKTSYPQILTSWDRIHQLLRPLIPTGAYTLGRTVVDYDAREGSIVAILDDGSCENADLLVGSDGFRSAMRRRMLPEVQPAFAGYVVWRAVANEADMPEDVHAMLFAEFGFFTPNDTQIVGYPIAGVGNDLREGHRRYNFVWYSAVSADVLRDMLTDGDGTYHPVSIPPPRIRDDVLARMEEDAVRRLPAAFVEIIRKSGKPFFTPIYDHCSPTFAKGRVALMGDAACGVRPHTGMGVTKAAQDALALASNVSTLPVEEGLAAYTQERLPASRRAYEQRQRLGALIFDNDPTLNKDGRSHPRIGDIMRDTAVPVL